MISSPWFIQCLVFVFVSLHCRVLAVEQWDYVRKFPLRGAVLDQCELSCRHDDKCQGWTIVPSSIKDINSTEESVIVGSTEASAAVNSTEPSAGANSTAPDVYNFPLDCYLLSEVMVNMTETSSFLFKQPPSVSGTKISYNAERIIASTTKTESSSLVQVKTLVPNPISVDTSTLINFPQHFVRDCSYSISVWVWLWRPRVLHYPDEKKVIFSTHEIHPRLSTQASLLPSIIYNAHAAPDKFFFSATRGTRKDYLGMYLGDVRYHEWIHLTLTLEANTMKAYIDGEYLDYLQVTNKLGPAACVYHTNMEVKIDDGDSSRGRGRDRGSKNAAAETTVAPIAAGGDAAVSVAPVSTPSTAAVVTTRKPPQTHDKQQQQQQQQQQSKVLIAGQKKEDLASESKSNKERPSPQQRQRRRQKQSSSRGAQFYESLLTDPWAVHVNNTMVYVMGDSGTGSSASIGMIHNLVVVRNAALSPKQVQVLMAKTTPPPMPTLKALLKSYNIPSLEGLCPVPLNATDTYQLWEWGLLPVILYGHICIDDAIFLKDGPITAGSRSGANSASSIKSAHDLAGTPGDEDLLALKQQPQPLSSSSSSSSPSITTTGLSQLARMLNVKPDPDVAHNLVLEEQASAVALSLFSARRPDAESLPDIGYPTAAIAHERSRRSKRLRDKQKQQQQQQQQAKPTKRHQEQQQQQQEQQEQEWQENDFLFHVGGTGDLLFPPLNLMIGLLQDIFHMIINVFDPRFSMYSFIGDLEHSFLDVIDGFDAKSPSSLWSSLLGGNTTGLNRTVRDTFRDNTTDHFSRIHKYELGRTTIDWYTSSREGKVQHLYKSAMMWMNGRYEAPQQAPLSPFTSSRSPTTTTEGEETDNILSPASTYIDAEINRDFTEWRKDTNEKAFASMSLALWMSEDIGNTSDPEDHPWAFRGASLISQPMHLALGFRSGYDRISEDYVPKAELESVLAMPTSPLLGSSLGGRNLARILVQQQLDSGVTTPIVLGDSTASGKGKGTQASLTGNAKSNSGDVTLERVIHTENFDVTISTDGDVSIALSASTPISVSLPGEESISNNLIVDSSVLHNGSYWLDIFANLTTDTIKADLSRRLLPLVEEGIVSSSVIHEDILQRQRQAALKNRRLSPQTRARMSKNSHKQPDEEAALRQRIDLDVTASLEHMPTTAPGPSFSNGGVMSDEECMMSASYYFPVTQYVNSQLGLMHSGAGVMEQVRLIVTGGDPKGHGGEQDVLHQHTEAEAHDGNPHAQTWLAKKYYWGFGGLDRDVMQARKWFERAAAQDDPEGLYNVGILYNNGQAGLVQSNVKAIEYFKKSADAKNPFPMALNEVGKYYLRTKSGEKNVTKAREYFLKAAARNSDDAHFSLAMMYREGQGMPVDIPRSVAHLAVASSWGHIPALNFLSHALYDSDSWLAQYGREQQILRRNQGMRAYLFSNSPKAASTATAANMTTTKTQTEVGYEHIDRSTERTSYTDALLRSSLIFNEFDLIKIYLKDGTIVPLPYPLGVHTGACQAALPMLKHIAEMSYRTKDVTRRALREYLNGNYWAALDLYEEAADLGVRAAQENAAYLIEQMIPTECARLRDYYFDTAEAPSSSTSSSSGSNNLQQQQQQQQQHSVNAIDRNHPPPSGMKCTTAEDCCRLYMAKLATRRWSQLSQDGEPRAMRRLADSMLSAEQSYIKRNATQAALLYSLAGEQGDTESLLHLGWMLYYGEDGIANNKAIADSIFTAAMKAEFGVDLLAESAALSAATKKKEREGERAKNQRRLANRGNAANGDDNDVGTGQEVQHEYYIDQQGDNEAVSPHFEKAEGDFSEDVIIVEEEEEEEEEEENDDEEREQSLNQHQFSRRWHTAGYASKSTGGVAPVLALAVVYVDQFLHSVLGMDEDAITARSLWRQISFSFESTLADAARYFDKLALSSSSSQSSSTASYGQQMRQLMRSWYDYYNRLYYKLVMQIQQMDAEELEIYGCILEIVFLSLILLTSSLVLRCIRRRNQLLFD